MAQALLTNIIPTYGVARKLVSDNAASFQSEVITRLWGLLQSKNSLPWRMGTVGVWQIRCCSVQGTPAPKGTQTLGHNGQPESRRTFGSICRRLKRRGHSVSTQRSRRTTGGKGRSYSGRWITRRN